MVEFWKTLNWALIGENGATVWQHLERKARHSATFWNKNPLFFKSNVCKVSIGAQCQDRPAVVIERESDGRTETGSEFLRHADESSPN